MKNTPMGNVREWIKSLSRIARNTPVKATITWQEEGNSIAIRLLNFVVDMDEYRAAVRSTLDECITHIHTKVLLNIDLPDSAWLLPESDNQEEHTRGEGLFTWSLGPGSDAAFY